MLCGAGDSAQLVECLASVHEALGLTPILYKPTVLVQSCNPSTYRVEAVLMRKIWKLEMSRTILHQYSVPPYSLSWSLLNYPGI